jgi:hypothetical protein
MMFENRKHDRFEYTGEKLEYTLTPFSEDEIFEAEIINYSQTGLCLLATNCISEGEEITIRSFINFTSQDAKVIWVEKTDEDLFKIGLAFI